jgi:hypothetical protein
VIPSCFEPEASDRASKIPYFAQRAAEVHTFWPSIRQPPSTLVARVASEARSLPAPGSENSWHQMISPRSDGVT